MSLMSPEMNGVQNPALIDPNLSALNKGKRNSVQPSRTSVMKKSSYVIGEQDIISPTATQAHERHAHSLENSEIESRNQPSGMET
jgi:hypothetical protein